MMIAASGGVTKQRGGGGLTVSFRSAGAEPESDDLAPLIRACARGEERALKRIYDAEAPRLTGIALRIVRSRAVAEEAVHDAFLQIWTRAGSFDPARGQGRVWITSIVRNRALSLLRRMGRETALDEDAYAELPDPAADPLADVARLQDADALKRCLQTLDEIRRRCILLAFVDGYSHSQIAELIEAPLGTVKAWIRRSLLALKECLG